VVTNFGATQFQIPNWALFANDTDPDSPLSIAGVSNNSGGTAAVVAGGINFTDTGGNGGSFDYTISVGSTVPSTAHVNVTQASGANPLNGTSGDDILIARPGAVTMNGSGGNDVFIGNTGAQIMNGGPGSDTFVFKAVADSTPGAGNFDTIQDFTPGVDHLDFTTIASTTSLHAMTSATDIAANSISWFKDGTQTIVYVNQTATVGHVDMEIHLTGSNINLSGSDILHHT